MKKLLKWWFEDDAGNKKVLIVAIIIFNTILAYFFSGAEFGLFTFVVSFLVGAGLFSEFSFPLLLIKLDLFFLLISPFVLLFLFLKKMFF